MTTITLKINEDTAEGKEFLESVHSLCKTLKEIEFVKIPNATTQKAIDDSKKGINLNKSLNHQDLMEQLLS
jgi:hypothetical protein